MKKIDLSLYMLEELEGQVAKNADTLVLSDPLFDKFKNWITARARGSSAQSPYECLYYKGKAVVPKSYHSMPSTTMYFMPRRHGKLTGITTHK